MSLSELFITLATKLIPLSPVARIWMYALLPSLCFNTVYSHQLMIMLNYLAIMSGAKYFSYTFLTYSTSINWREILYLQNNNQDLISVEYHNRFVLI